MDSSKYSILVVDDEELIRNFIVTLLSKLGHSCVIAIHGMDALKKIKENKIDAVITDIKMPEMDGILLIRELYKLNPELPVMVMTAFDEEYSAGTAISVGAREFIKKPFSLDEFVLRFHKMMRDSEAMKRMKKEKGPDEDVEYLMGELEAALKKDKN